MRVQVTFYSYFKDLTGCVAAEEHLAEGSTLGLLLETLRLRFPKLEPMKNSTLAAVGIDYQPKSFVLHDGDQVALFPPVQGG